MTEPESAPRGQPPPRTFPEILGAARAQLDRASAPLLLWAACLPVVYIYYGVPGFYRRHLAVAGAPDTDVHAEIYRFACVFLLFFVVPALAHRRLAGGRLSELGLGLGEWRLGLKLAAAALLLVTPLLWVNSASPAMQAEYPLARGAASSGLLFAGYEASYALYYWGWEFFFRGALQLGLAPALGPLGAMMTQLLPSVLLHIGKPDGEIWGAVVVAPLFGAAALRTRSFLYIFLFHYAIGVINDLFCALRLGLL